MILKPHLTPDAGVTQTETGWRLQIPAGPAGAYRLAQLDDYAALPRSRFPWSAPTALRLRCRVSPPFLPPNFVQSNSDSAKNMLGQNWGERGGWPGTWGFGFWNDPFAVSLGLQGAARRLPALPNAIWFFHASAQNYISLRSRKGNNFPGNGFMAQVFSSPQIPSLLLAPGLLALPLMFSKMLAKWIRAVGGEMVKEESISLDVDVTQWHEYSLRWDAGHVAFALDGIPLFETESAPKGPLGLVIWVDNQFAAFRPDGKIQAGTEENPVPAWMEVADLEVG